MSVPCGLKRLRVAATREYFANGYWRALQYLCEKLACSLRARNWIEVATTDNHSRVTLLFSSLKPAFSFAGGRSFILRDCTNPLQLLASAIQSLTKRLTSSRRGIVEQKADEGVPRRPDKYASEIRGQEADDNSSKPIFGRSSSQNYVPYLGARIHRLCRCLSCRRNRGTGSLQPFRRPSCRRDFRLRGDKSSNSVQTRSPPDSADDAAPP